MEEINEKIFLIIEKKISGNASENEIRELDEWIQKSPTNLQEYLLLEEMFLQIDTTLEQKVDTNAAWGKVQKRTKSLTQIPIYQSEKKIINIFSKINLVAASAVLLVFFISRYIYVTFDNPETITISAIKNNKEIKLPDGSGIALKKGSSLSYSKNFLKDRKVYLSGQGIFDVVHDNKNTFRIVTPRALIEDIGTSFFILNSPTKDQVFVFKGKVKCSGIKTPKHFVLLEEGDNILIDTNGFRPEKVLNPNLLAWKTGNLKFVDAPLKQVFIELNEFYGENISCSSEVNAENIKVNFQFDNQPLVEVLEEIKISTRLQLKKVNGNYVFYSK